MADGLPPGWSIVGGKLRYLDPRIKSKYQRGLRIGTSMTLEEAARIAANRGLSVSDYLRNIVSRNQRFVERGGPLFSERVRQALKRLKSMKRVQ